jgi:NADPH2:quinone reductase
MKAAVKQTLGQLPALHTLDAISTDKTWVPLSQMMATGGQVSVVSGADKYDDVGIPEGVEIKYTYVGSGHSGTYLPTMPKQPLDKEWVKSTPEFSYVFFRYVARILASGALKGHPYEVIPGGLNGVELGLQKLKRGENKGKKYVYRIADTEGGN